MSDEVDVRIERPVAGGLGLSRLADGRVVLVDGGLPDELVRVELESSRGTLFGSVTEVLEASEGRVDEPHCPHVLDECGGCDHADATPELLRRMKAEVLADAYRRLGKLQPPEIHAGPPLATERFRTAMRVGVVDGRAGLRRIGSNEIIPLSTCVVATAELESLVVEGRFGGATEAALRVSVATGEATALFDPDDEDAELPEWVRTSSRRSTDPRRAWLHETVCGRSFRVSAGSFFQSRTDGAAALVETVRGLVGPLRPGAVVVDAYAGVGLFGGALADGTDARVLAVESSRSSVADARHNLRDLDARVIRTPVASWNPSHADLVVADPPRSGLGRKAAERLVATEAPVIVLVSCDPAAAGRDARLLIERGYRLEAVSMVDLFPHTHHLEAVARFAR